MSDSNSPYANSKPKSDSNKADQYRPEIGRYATLPVVEHHPAGCYLDGGDLGDILLPNKQVPENTEIGDKLKVFIYLDSEDRIIATMQRPRVLIRQAANLQVVDVNDTGAFLDWGLAKDLFLPFSEQKQRLEIDQHCIVYVHMDNTGRLAATTRLNRFIKDESEGLKVGDKVKLLIAGRTQMGYKAIVNDEYWGLIHNESIRQAIRIGQRVEGYVRKVRDDKKLDLSLEPIGYKKVDPLKAKILKKLKESNGFLAVGDKSPADLIEMHFGVSKRVYKMAIGKLYKERIIAIESNGIRLLKK